jgi:hypothetical protein
MSTRITREYQVAFLSLYGAGPYTCHFCGEPADSYGRGKGLAQPHHIDGDKENNDPANLVPAHGGCHTKHHTVGNTYSRGKHHTEEWKQENALRMSGEGNPFFGKKHPPELMARIAARAAPKIKAAKEREWAPGGKRRVAHEKRKAAMT